MTTDLDTLRAVHLAASMQQDATNDLWRVVRAAVHDLASRGHSQAELARQLRVTRARIHAMLADPVDTEAGEGWDNLRKGNR